MVKKSYSFVKINSYIFGQKCKFFGQKKKYLGRKWLHFWLVIFLVSYINVSFFVVIIFGCYIFPTHLTFTQGITIQSSEVLSRARAASLPVTEKDGVSSILSPSGYKFILVDQPQPVNR